MARQSQARPTRDRASRARQPKREALQKAGTQDVYQEMLEEAEARDPEQFRSDRPIKRRRVGDSRAIAVHSPEPTQMGTVTNQGNDEGEQAQSLQTVYDLSETDESEVEWEDVDIKQPAPEASSVTAVSQGNSETLQITLEQETDKRKKTVQRRKPVTAAEKKIRMDIHKVHLLCLLAHVNLRNQWCNSGSVQVCMALVDNLHPKSNSLLELPETNVAQEGRCTIESRRGQASVSPVYYLHRGLERSR